MKRLSFFMIAAVVAVSSVFVSCSKDDEKEDPGIRVLLNGTTLTSIVDVDPGSVVAMEIEWTSNGGANLKEIDLQVKNGSRVDGFPLKSGLIFGSGDFDTKIKHTYKMDVSAPESIAENGGTIVYYTTVEDNKGGLRNLEISITFKKFQAPTPPAPSEGNLQTTTHAMKYVSKGNSANSIVPPFPGFEWSSNPTANSATFRASGTNGGIIMLASKDEYDALQTKQDLSNKYTNATTTPYATVTFNFGTSGMPKCFIVRNGNDLAAVKMTELTASPGNNTATIEVKK